MLEEGSLEEALFSWISQYGYVGIFSLLMFGIIGVPVPDEALLAFSGYLVFKGQLGMISTLASAFLGSVCGISISYWLGRKGGLFLIHRYGHRVRVTPEKIERVGQWLRRSGRWGFIIGYFIPGVRHLTALAAGTVRLKYSVFATFAYAGALLWSITFITGGFFLGREWLRIPVLIHRIALVACASIAYLALLSYLLNRKGHKKS